MALLEIIRFAILFVIIRHTHSTSESISSEILSSLPTLPSLDTFLQSPSLDSVTGQFKINDQCSATVSKVETTFQVISDPMDCINMGNLLQLILPGGQGNFDMGTSSDGFVVLENIIIRSLAFDIASKKVDIQASYATPVSIIPGILTISNLRLDVSFVSTHSETWRFDISASLTIGSIVIDVSIIRDDDGYYLDASSSDNINASDIAQLFQTSDSFLPETGLESSLTEANFDTFAIEAPRVKAAFTDGYGFLFGGQIRILDWEPFEVNLLINSQNDAPTAVTIAVFTKSFSISQMFNDLFKMDISSVPVIGDAMVTNLALCISTQQIDSPLVLLDVGYKDIFDLPYRKGIIATFEVSIIDVIVSISIVITPTEIRLTLSQEGDLTLRKIINAFLPTDSNLISGDGDGSTLSNWPTFISFDPLAISVSFLDIGATKIESSGWGLSSLQIKLEMTESIVFFDDIITISDLKFEMTYTKTENSSDVSGLITGTVSIGSGENVSPKVDVRIPFPFANEEITFTFTDFNVQNISSAFGFTIPTASFSILTQIQLDFIGLTFNDAGELNKISIKTSIPNTYPIYGDFSVSQLKFAIEIDNMANSTAKTWVFRMEGHILISACDIFIQAEIGSAIIKFQGTGTNCHLSIGDILAQISVNPDTFPSMISGFTLSEPVFSFSMIRETSDKMIGFGATTSLFGSSDVEIALINSAGSTSIVAGFAVQSASAIPEISFLSGLGLTELAVMYVSRNIRSFPYTWGKSVFNTYAPTDSDVTNGLKIFARFRPSEGDLMGKLLKDAGETSIAVSLTLPDLLFTLDIDLGDGLPLGNTGGKFVSMGLIISKRLLGLNLVFSLTLEGVDLRFTGELTFTFGGTVTISLLMQGNWSEPLGLRNFEIYKLGLALGINVVSLLPSFGLTGEIKVTPPSRPPIEAGITICVDTANPLATVFEIHFSRLLLQDIVNVFTGRNVAMPDEVAEMGFPEEVRIFFSPAGNERCFGKSYDAGIEIHGTFQIPFLQVYAVADISIKFEPFHLKADLRLNPINYGNGLLQIVSAQSNSVGPYLFMNIGNADEFLINGSCKVVLFGASISIRLEVTKERLFFEGRLNLWNLFQVYLMVDLEYSGSDPKLHIIGEMQNDLFTKIKQRATQGIRNGARAINNKISGAQTKIRNAQNEVNNLLNTIRYHERKIQEAKNECSRAPWYRKYICIGSGARIIYHGIIMGGIWIAYGVAKGVLFLADLFLEGVKGLITIASEALVALVNAALSIIDIKYIRFEVLLTSTKQIFDFTSEIVIMGWTLTPSFSINFSSSSSAQQGINSAGDSVSSDTVSRIEK